VVRIINHISRLALKIVVMTREQGTGNREQGTGYRLQVTGNREQVTGYREQGTGYREQGTGFGQLYFSLLMSVFSVYLLTIEDGETPPLGV
jgi:hypothetical protein